MSVAASCSSSRSSRARRPRHADWTRVAAAAGGVGGNAEGEALPPPGEEKQSCHGCPPGFFSFGPGAVERGAVVNPVTHAGSILAAGGRGEVCDPSAGGGGRGESPAGR